MPAYTINYSVRSADGETVEQRGVTRNWNTGATPEEAAKIYRTRLAEQLSVDPDRIEVRVRIER